MVDLKNVVKDKKFWMASFIIAWAAALQVRYLYSNPYLFSSLLFSSILHLFSCAALRFQFQGHMMWLQRQDSFKEKFGNSQDHPQNPN